MNANSPISVEAVTELLEKNKDKHPLNTINNAVIVFRNDPLFAGKPNFAIDAASLILIYFPPITGQVSTVGSAAHS